MTKRTQDEAAAYWSGGYRADPDAAQNVPGAYLPSYIDLLQRQSFTDELVRRVAPVAPSSVLEIGCNAGRNLWVLAERFSPTRISGIDINPEAIEYLRKHCPAERWELIVTDVMSDGLPEPVVSSKPSFDVVFSLAVLVHMEPGPAKERLVKQMWDATTKRLILIEPHRSGARTNISEDRTKSPFWVDDYRRYLPFLTDEGPARSGNPDSLDGIPLGRAGQTAARLARTVVETAGRRSEYRVLIADR